MLHQRWHPLTRCEGSPIPMELLSWLGERNSLTRRLRRHFGGDVEVRIRSQSWKRPAYDEASHLGVKPTTVALVREVYLLCNGRVCIYARSVIPLQALTGPLRRLKFLGTRPLGDLLFADPNIARRTIEVTSLASGSRLHASISVDTPIGIDVIWGRRSVFHLRGKPILVSEYFLPALCQTPSIPRNRRPPE